MIEIFRPGLFVEDIIDDTAIHETLQELTRLLDHQITALQAVLIRIGHKLLQRVLALQVTLHFPHILHLTEPGTVLVGIGIGKLQDQTRHRGLLIIRGHIYRILRDEDIRCDTTTAIDRTAIAGVIGRTCMFDAVLREELTMLVAFHPVALIVLSIGIRFLDATA